ncbi:MAG: DUF4905 domain-containing protein [Bacteroidota bacterium]|nr:DUF4905 domain-containing protein [Bacteroidota bacterium]
MKFSSLFRRRRSRQDFPLVPLWTFTTQGILWRLLFSETNFIVGEDRDTAKKSVTFFCLNAHNGDVLWRDMAYDEAWWIGIEAIVDDRVYLHGFHKPDMPEHSKITAVDLATGKVLWRNDQNSFFYATAEKVVAFRDVFERRLFCELNAATGELLAEMNECPAEAYDVKGKNHGRTDFLFPQTLNDDVESIPLRHLVEANFHEDNIRGDIEFVRVNGAAIVNLHVVTKSPLQAPPGGSRFGIGMLRPEKPGEGIHGEVLQNSLHIFDERTGEELFAEVLNAETPAAVPDSFFVDQSIVYFVKERKTLVALDCGQHVS